MNHPDPAGGQLGHPGEDGQLSHRTVLAIAVPIIASNMTTPLIGFVNTTVIGQLGEPHLIGAVAVGAMIFSILYLGFGFLRMGTTGLTAQALGARDHGEVAAMLARSVMIALVFGCIMLAFSGPIIAVIFQLVEPSAAVGTAAREYFGMRIWGAPAALINFALLGWFIGLGRAKLAFWLQLFLNGLNIALAIAFVQYLGWGVPGVGLAAALADGAAAVAGLIVAYFEMRRRGGHLELARVFDTAKLRRVMSVNRDILIRSLALMTATAFFTAQGMRAGDLTLASNAILIQWLYISAYMLDGFAFAAEVLVGQALGAGKRDRFERAARLSTVWAVLISLVLSAALVVAGPWIIDFMTTSPDVRQAARIYYLWAALTPIAGVLCFQLDGIFIGATWTADMRNMMLLSLAAYFAAWAVLMPQFGNHGLWASMLIFFLVRAATLWWRYPKLVQASFQDAHA